MRASFSILFLTSLLIVFINNFFASIVYAADTSLSCANRYLALVNPVRGRDLWSDKSLEPLKQQYAEIKKYSFSATWLLQYDALTDQDIISLVKSFDGRQEVGLFLEVSPNMAYEARVVYPHATAWANPKALFLSGYSQSERKKLIDTLFRNFKRTFGYFPKSVGAWWIDSYSLSYMQRKYGVKSAMIVADQKTTDNYGVWGQWWGYPYFPSKANILTPATSKNLKENVVIIQWAQRHPDLAYGEGLDFSNYSLQANDYVRQRKTTDFFKNLTNIYLSCDNSLGQITVGLETGMESVDFSNEYQKQLAFLKSLPNLESVTMSKFAEIYGRLFEINPEMIKISGKSSVWVLTRESRQNAALGDKGFYNPEVSFSDYFVRDSANFLDRRLPEKTSRSENGDWQPYYLLVFVLAGWLFYRKKKFSQFLAGALFTVLAFGLFLRSNAWNGWTAYYGPVASNLALVQVFLVAASFVFIWILSKRTSLVWFLPLSFAIDKIVSLVRYTLISGEYYFGIALDTFRFVGLKASKPFSLSFVNQDFPSVQAAALLRFNFQKIWNNNFISFLVYPLVHLIIAIVIYSLLKKLKPRLRRIIILILIAFLVLQMVSIFKADPRVAIVTAGK